MSGAFGQGCLLFMACQYFCRKSRHQHTDIDLGWFLLFCDATCGQSGHWERTREHFCWSHSQLRRAALPQFSSVLLKKATLSPYHIIAIPKIKLWLKSFAEITHNCSDMSSTRLKSQNIITQVTTIKDTETITQIFDSGASKLELQIWWTYCYNHRLRQPHTL